MVSLSSGVFNLVLLTPQGKLLDCRCGSLVLPGHDGQLGILRNHAPMLCKLGFGLMKVEDIAGRDTGAYFVVDGGFARVSENQVTVLAYDITTFEGLEAEEARKLLQEAQKTASKGEYIDLVKDSPIKKAALIVKMGQYAKVVNEETGE